MVDWHQSYLVGKDRSKQAFRRQEVLTGKRKAPCPNMNLQMENRLIRPAPRQKSYVLIALKLYTILIPQMPIGH